MRFRKLRIAWSVGCAIACLLLIVLWVRSYWWTDAVYIAHLHNVVSMRGELCIDCGVSHPASQTQLSRHYGPIDSLSIWNGDGKVSRDIDAVGVTWPANWTRIFPIWLLTGRIAAVSTAPWLRWRFSVRTLLIATTLVAVVLGLIVAMSGER
jgi:hypothetical protein